MFSSDAGVRLNFLWRRPKKSGIACNYNVTTLSVETRGSMRMYVCNGIHDTENNSRPYILFLCITFASSRLSVTTHSYVLSWFLPGAIVSDVGKELVLAGRSEKSRKKTAPQNFIS